MRRLRKQIGRALVVTVLFTLALGASVEAKEPRELPSIALGWGMLFHVERAGVLLGVIGVVLLVGWRATDGDFPIRLGQVEYASRTANEVAATAATQDLRICYLEHVLGLRGDSGDGNDSYDT
jgi:hypothetical protein